MIDGAISLPTIITLIGFAITGLGVWYNTRAQVQKNTETIKDQQDRIRILEEARGTTARELAEYKLQVAKEYATTNSIREIEERVVQAIEKLGARLDKFFDSPRSRSRSNQG